MFRPDRDAAAVILVQQSIDIGVDHATGIRIGIPRHLVGEPNSTQYGRNWKAPDNRLNIDSLNFRGVRTLDSVFQAIRNRPRRTITHETNDGSSFTLQGSDGDGTIFYVQAAERGGEVRGISIVYSGRWRIQLEPVVASMVRSFVAFPEPPPPPPTPEPPRTAAVTRPAPPQTAPAASSSASDAAIAAMQKELEEMRQKMRVVAPPTPPPQEPQPRPDPTVIEMRREIDELRRAVREREQREWEDRIRKDERDKLEKKIRELEDKFKRPVTPQRKPIERPVASGILPPGKRVAFVVGINAYPELGANQQLERAVNDAILMRSTFEKLGFDVEPVPENPNRREFFAAWQSFLRKIEPGSTAAFFFAGHGVQIAGANYLLPSDVPNFFDAQERLENESLSFNALYENILRRKPRFSLLILDACRNNPFNTRGRAIGGSRGLSTVKPIEGSFVLYSANADEQALDSLPDDLPDEPNSVFTRVLAPMLLKPDVPLQDIARQVRINVADLTSAFNHKQWPSYYDGLTGNVCLIGTCRPMVGAK